MRSQIDRVEAGSHVHHTEHHIFKMPKRYALLNIHPIVEQVVERSGIQDGFVFISAMHITAGVYVNDAEIGLLHDIARVLSDLAPYSQANYQHHETGEDNGDAHIKSLVTNHFCQVPITKSRLDIGPYQQVFYAEYDGLREKRIIIKVQGLAGAKSASKPSATQQS